jgi:Ca2+-binding RTX toxin-like protein
MRRALGGLATAAVAACTLGAWATPASGSTIYTRGSATTQQYVYAGSTGEQNLVVVREVGGNYNFVELNPSVTISGPDFRCSQVAPNQVNCPKVDQDGLFFTADAELHNLDDNLDMRTTTGSRISGGAGNDTLKGGSGSDSIVGDEGGDPSASGNDWIDGRGGADYMGGEAGTDTISYESRSTPVRVTLDGFANDGDFGGEGDNADMDLEILKGTNAGDDLTGSNAANEIYGFGGFDVIYGFAGVDTIHAGDSDDWMDGGAGNDQVLGEGGADTVRGGWDSDSLVGADQDDRLFGGPGADDMSGGPGFDQTDYAGSSQPLTVTAADDAPNDGAINEGDNVHSDVERILGSSGPDRLTPIDFGEVWGRGGNDTLFGGGQDGDDRLEGGDGDDTLDGRWGADVMNGGGGTDTLDYSEHYVVFDDPPESFGVNSIPNGLADDGNGFIDRSATVGNFDNVGNDIEDVTGTPAPDVLQGTGADNVLNGGGEADELGGSAGDDELYGYDGADDITGGPGADFILGYAGNDGIDGGSGPDTMDGGADTDTVSYAGRQAAVRVTINAAADDGDDAANEGDWVTSSVENVRGGGGDDVLVGSLFPNRLIGGGGDDNLNGGDGPDVLDGQTGTDTMVYTGRPDPVAVTLDGNRNDGADPNQNGISTMAEEGDMDLGIENVNGGAGDDILRAPVADAVRNVLRGFDGNDTLDSREGTATIDMLACGAGGADRFAADPSDTQNACEVAQ